MAKTFWKVLRETTESDVKFAPQERIVRDAMFALAKVGQEVDQEKIIEKIDQDGELETTQGTARIVQYYRRTLEQRGLMLSRKEAAPKPEKKEKAEAGAAQTEEEEAA